MNRINSGNDEPLSRLSIPDNRNLHLHVVIAAIALALVALAIGGDAFGGDRTKLTGKLDGAVLYHNYCSVCHGDAGDGKSRARGSLIPAPADFTSAQLQGKLTREYMSAIVRDGKPGTAMVGWKTQLNEQEIAAVVDYVRVFFVDHAGDEALKRGRVLYGHLCVNCHGVDGTGKLGVAAAGGVKPRDLTSDVSRREISRERLITAIAVGKKGTPMAGFAGQLSANDIDALAEYVKVSIMSGRGGAISGTSAHAR